MCIELRSNISFIAVICIYTALDTVLGLNSMYIKNFRTFCDMHIWADFFRYVNWHNNAFHVQKNMILSSLLLYYEDYEEEGKWNQSMDQILHFLNQTKASF